MEQEREFSEQVFCDQGTVHFLAVVDNEPIGVVGFTRIKKEVGTAEITYWIIPSEWGDVYGPEAAERLIQYGFNQRNLHKVVAQSFAHQSMSKKPHSVRTTVSRREVSPTAIGSH